MSVLEARVRLRDGLRALHDEGRSLDEHPIAPVVNELLDCCGSDHRPLVDLLRLVLRHSAPVRGAPLSTEEWRVVLAGGVTRLERSAFLEADAARWALETLYYAHGRLDEVPLAPVVPFESTALRAEPVLRRSAPQPPRLAVYPASGPSTSPMAGYTPARLAAMPMAHTAGMLTASRSSAGSSLRFGQPWYAVQNGNAPIALPSPSRGPRRPPPIAPLSNMRAFAGWTRQTFAIGGVLGAVTLTIAFSYWFMLNAARTDPRDRLGPALPAGNDSLRLGRTGGIVQPPVELPVLQTTAPRERTP
jgi:hypothetical protein